MRLVAESVDVTADVAAGGNGGPMWVGVDGPLEHLRIELARLGAVTTANFEVANLMWHRGTSRWDRSFRVLAGSTNGAFPFRGMFRLHMIRELLTAGFAVPFLERLGRYLSLYEQRRKLARLCLTLERHDRYRVTDV